MDAGPLIDGQPVSSQPLAAEEITRYVVTAAVWAPSVHNTQPGSYSSPSASSCWPRSVWAGWLSWMTAGQTGPAWQRATLAAATRRHDTRRALAVMLHHYLQCADTGLPVHTWPAASWPG
jgi:hypothetical protein